MTHFYESFIMMSKDGMQLKSYTNEHPKDFVIAKPKYVPVNTVFSKDFQEREIYGKKVNRFDYWATDEKGLNTYIDKFREQFPDYVYDCDLHNNWFFGVPRSKIQHLPDPRKGVQDILNKKEDELDVYLKLCQDLLHFFKDGGLDTKNIGVTNSTLLGTYTYGRSDVDVIMFGKDNYWKYNEFIRDAKHPKLRWRDIGEWKKYFATYNAGLNFSESEFIRHAQRKFSDGLFDETVFSVFGVEEPHEVDVRWGDENYTNMGMVTVKGDVVDSYNGVVRPGFYEIENSSMIEGPSVKVKKIVTYARDFMLQAFKGEKLAAKGILEKVEPVNGQPYHRVVIGYFDSYINRRGQEFIKTLH